MRKSIAIVEDEPALRQNYSDILRRQGYEVTGFESREEALQQFNRHLPDLAILDIGLKDEIDGGFELCRQLRMLSSSIPIIFLTARDSDFDTIAGLRLGADDYLTKDISLPHLIARIAALFRRIEILHQPASTPSLHQVGKLALDLDRFTTHWDKHNVELTLTEFWIVYSLAKRPGHVKKREQLMEDASIVVDDSTITSHIKRIRMKFQKIDIRFDAIDTVYGIGYRWKDSLTG